jgi:hypothetical protein
MLPNDGVGLVRMEFIVNEHIGVHPMALACPEKIASKKARVAIERLVRTIPSRPISLSRNWPKGSARSPPHSIRSR